MGEREAPDIAAMMPARLPRPATTAPPWRAFIYAAPIEPSVRLFGAAPTLTVARDN